MIVGFFLLLLQGMWLVFFHDTKAQEITDSGGALRLYDQKLVKDEPLALKFLLPKGPFCFQNLVELSMFLIPCFSILGDF